MRRILLRFLISVTISFALIAGGAFVIVWSYSQIPWSVNSMLFKILDWIRNYILFIVVVSCTLSILIILYVQWKQLISYLVEVVGAVEILGEDKNKMVELPSILKETQDQFNQVRNKIKDKEIAAREAEQRKNDLVVYLAHDLKTPISSIMGYLMLLRDEKHISQEMHDRYMAVALNNAERLDDLINEFFEITRFNLSHITLEYSRINLKRLLEQLVFEFQPMLSEKNLLCSLDMPTDMELQCDADKMQRVFDNLIRNAINYSFENSEIQIVTAVSDTRVTINFVNSGNTIPAEKLERIFEQFYRLDSSRSSRTGGVGLGLAIAKEIVELHHGRIVASSHDNTICFAVELPLS
ncbi:sensor histidine kinase [Marininema mesophilum]|nr:HAMP domain-containing sensor histidine kinase [Marininema mesophilum]